MLRFLCVLVALCQALGAKPAAEVVDAFVKRHGSPHSWTPEVVADALAEAGFGTAVGVAVIEHGVTGDLLESYETKEELLSLGITSLADTKRMDIMTKAMKQRHTGASKTFFFTVPSLPANDHELVALRALNRYGFTQDFNLLMGNPWLATWWFNRQAAVGVPNALHIFDQHPKSAQFSWDFWLLFPEWMVVQHVSSTRTLPPPHTHTPFTVSNSTRFNPRTHARRLNL